MKKKSVALTGASSFSAVWIAKALSEKGYEIHSLLQKNRTNYDTIKKVRLEFLSSFSKIHENLAINEVSTIEWIQKFKPSFWIHHHHYMQDFRLPQYDIIKADELCLKPLPILVKTLKDSGCQGIVYTGTYYEKPELHRVGLKFETPYSQSKRMVWEKLQSLSKENGIPLSKVIIPNPIGPMESTDRLLSLYFKDKKLGKTLVLKNPDLINDFVPIDEIADCYANAIQNIEAGNESILKPSHWIMSNKEFLINIEEIFRSGFTNDQNKLIDRKDFWKNYLEYINIQKI